LKQIVLLGLVLSAISAGGSHAADDLVAVSSTVAHTDVAVTGSTMDDYHEATDVEIKASSSTSMNYQKTAFQAKAGEQVISQRILNNTVPIKTTTFPQTDMSVNAKGEVVQKVTTITTNIYESSIIRRIKKFWNKTADLATVKQIAILFAKQHGGELLATEMTLFNSIASTDGNEFESKYHYFQYSHKVLETKLRKALTIFKTPLPDVEVKKLMLRIQDCNEGAIAELIQSAGAETHRKDAWTVVAQLFLATCKKELPYVQVFAWMGAKSGAYKPNKWNDRHAMIVDDYITRFLFHQVYLLWTCEIVPPFTSEPVDHVDTEWSATGTG
jgi:hypothetical protein